MSRLIIVRQYQPDRAREVAALLLLIERRLARHTAAAAPRANAGAGEEVSR